MRRVCLLLVALTCAALSGCAAYGPAPKPITPDEVVQMVKDGLNADAIVQKLQESGTVYQLSASQLIKLSKQGVPEEVLDYMQSTYLAAVRDDEARRAFLYSYGPYGAPYPYGRYWYGYPYWRYWHGYPYWW